MKTEKTRLNFQRPQLDETKKRKIELVETYADPIRVLLAYELGARNISPTNDVLDEATKELLITTVKTVGVGGEKWDPEAYAPVVDRIVRDYISREYDYNGYSRRRGYARGGGYSYSRTGKKMSTQQGTDPND